jgi:hypothetical protein
MVTRIDDTTFGEEEDEEDEWGETTNVEDATAVVEAEDEAETRQLRSVVR